MKIYWELERIILHLPQIDIRMIGQKEYRKLPNNTVPEKNNKLLHRFNIPIFHSLHILHTHESDPVTVDRHINNHASN